MFADELDYLESEQREIYEDSLSDFDYYLYYFLHDDYDDLSMDLFLEYLIDYEEIIQ